MRWLRRRRPPERPPADAPAVTPPIVVGSDDGLVLFASPAAVVRGLEEPDVRDGVYGPAFDAAGRHRVAVRPIAVAVAREAPPEPEALAALLRERLPSDERDLATLLERAIARFGIDG